MHLNLQIDDTLLQEAARLGGQHTPQTLILEALREYIRHRKQPAISRTEDQAALAWSEWLAQSDDFAARILRRREGRPVDVDGLLNAARKDLEDRHDELFGH